jgi:hypothetical protein
MSVPKWLSILQTVGLAALQASPLAPIADSVTVAIAAAEAIKGATGAQKLAQVLVIAKQAAATAQELGANIDPALVELAGAKAISTAVDVTNIVHQAHAADAPAAT